jgi:hypothetical protein
MEKFGIENIKTLLKLICTLTVKIIDDLKDRKISVIEALGILYELRTVPSVINNTQNIIDEIKDLSQDETIQLIYFMKGQFPDLSNQATEITDRSIKILISVLEFIDAINLKNKEITG